MPFGDFLITERCKEIIVIYWAHVSFPLKRPIEMQKFDFDQRRKY